MTNSLDDASKAKELELDTSGSMMDRFSDLTRRLLSVSREEVKAAEKVFKLEQQKKRRAKRNEDRKA